MTKKADDSKAKAKKPKAKKTATKKVPAKKVVEKPKQKAKKPTTATKTKRPKIKKNEPFVEIAKAPSGRFKNTKSPYRKSDTKYTEEMFRRIIKCHQQDFTVEEVCASVGISGQTYYRWLKEVDGLSEEIEKAKNYLFRLSKANLAKAIREGDAGTSKWVLERRCREQYSTKIQNEVKEVNEFSDLKDEELAKLAYGNAEPKQD